MKKKLCILAMMTALCMTGCTTQNLGSSNVQTQQETEKTEDKKEETAEVTAEVTEEPTTEATDDTTTEVTTEAMNTPSIPVEQQMDLIASRVENWKLYETACYAITDFDVDGYLELVAATPMAGTGLYTYADFYEVSDDGAELVKWEYEGEQEGVSHADLAVSDTTGYYNESENVYYYIFKDNLRMGPAESYEATLAWSVKDNVIREETLAYVNTTAEDENTVQSDYFRGNDESITEEEYNNITEQIFADQKKCSLKCEWIMLEPDELDGMEKEDVLKVLTQSFNAFLVR